MAGLAWILAPAGIFDASFASFGGVACGGTAGGDGDEAGVSAAVPWSMLPGGLAYRSVAFVAGAPAATTWGASDGRALGASLGASGAAEVDVAAADVAGGPPIAGVRSGGGAFIVGGELPGTV